MVGEFVREWDVFVWYIWYWGCKDKESCYKLYLLVIKKRGRMFIFNDVYGLCLFNVLIRG